MTAPNIIHFHAESWDGRMLGCQGYHPAMDKATPNIDQLAEEGVIFENTYCTNPICCPSRANMLSGTYTHTCESWSNFKGLETGMWTLHRGLKQTHDTLLLGKHMDHLTGGHSIMNRVADFLEPLNDKSLPVMNDDTAQNFAIDPGNEERYHERDWKILDEASDFIRERKEEDRPFFISINSNLVHAAFKTNRYWLEKIPEELVDVPALDTSDHPAEVYQRHSKGWRFGLDDDTVKTVRRIYFAMCAEGDAIVGKLLEGISQKGLAENTVFLFSSDHGELALEHQQYYKMSLLEGSARVPLVMRGPGIPAGQRVQTPVSLVDLAPTICDIAGLPLRASFDGESLLPVAQAKHDVERGWALASYSGVTSNTFSWMLRKDEYKLIVHEGFPHRLFNLEKDPGELNDLAATESKKVNELLGILDGEVNRKETIDVWEKWRKDQFAQFNRQAKRGLYLDQSYSLAKKPSSTYEDLIDNAMTGWSSDDEDRAQKWLSPS